MPARRPLRVAPNPARLAALVAFNALAWSAPALAFDQPKGMDIDAGDLGTWNLSAGADAYAYALTNAGNSYEKGLLGTSSSVGLQFMNGLVQLQKSEGLLQATFQVGAVNSLTVGTKPTATSIQTYSTGPVRRAYVTLAPIEGLTISAGQMDSLEGYESGIDWLNSNVMLSPVAYTQASQGVAVSASYTTGPFTGTISYGDGFNTNVWNYLQGLATYKIDDNNSANIYGATNVGITGNGARFYGNATTSYWNTTVGSAGAANFVNSSMVGAFYTWTTGNWSVTPEAQYVWVKPISRVGIEKFSSNFSAALFVNYAFADTPWSVGSFGSFFSSNGQSAWYLNPGSQGWNLSITPTWTYEKLFIRGNAGFTYLTNIGTARSPGYSSSANSRTQATFLIEAGLLF